MSALGAQVAYSFEFAGTPVSARVKILREVDVENRSRGTIGLFTLAFPIGHVPTGAKEPASHAMVMKR